MSERQSIEIDYCPGCRGVWLDRGELDKIIQQSTHELASAREQPAAPARHQPEYRSERHGSQQESQHESQHRLQHNNYHHDYRRPKKKESFWQELFD